MLGRGLMAELSSSLIVEATLRGKRMFTAPAVLSSFPGTRAGRETSLYGAVGGHTHVTRVRSLCKNCTLGFPGGPVVEDLPCNAGGTRSIADPGRSRRPQSNYARAPHPQNSHSANTEPSTLEPVLGNKRSHSHEKPKHCS